MMNCFRTLSVICAVVAVLVAGGAEGAAAQNWGWNDGYGRAPDQRPPYGEPGYGATGRFTASPFTASPAMASRRHTVSSLSTVSRVTVRPPAPAGVTRDATTLNCS